MSVTFLVTVVQLLFESHCEILDGIAYSVMLNEDSICNYNANFFGMYNIYSASQYHLKLVLIKIQCNFF